MKNNTKLIVETWRRFLNEGDMDDPGQTRDPDQMYTDSEVPLEGDEDLGFAGDGFDSVTQSGPEDFDMNVKSIRELLDEQDLSDDEFLNLQYTQEEIDVARAQHQEEMPDRMEGMDDFDNYDSAAAGEELASLGPIDDEPMGDY